MLHILWMLIKFILIVLCILLGLVLLAILLLLFDPIRYRAQVKKDGAGLQTVTAEACVSWLFGLISLRAFYMDGGPGIAIRIFGVPFEKLKGFLDRKKASASAPPAAKKKKTSRKKPSPEGKPSRPDRVEGSVASEAAKPSESGFVRKETLSEAMPDIPAKKEIPQESMQEDVPSAPGLFSRIWGMLKSILGFPFRAVKFLFTLPGKMTAAIRRLWLAIQNIRDKISWYQEFLGDEHTKAALLLVKAQASGLIRHILPTKVDGDVIFGCEDPSLTGKILAVLGMSFPFHKNCVAVTPVFDGENHLSGRISLKGRVYGIVILIAALKIVLNKNTKYVISRWKSKA